MPKRRIRDGGALALGISIGALFTFGSFLFLQLFDLLPFRDPALVGAVIGALIAGGIGVCGQLLVMVQNDITRSNEKANIERQLLEELLAKTVRILSSFAQTREHMESTDPFDNVVFETLPPLMKPLRVNDLHQGFETHERVVPLSISDQRFFNFLNILDSILANFRWSYTEYEARMDAFVAELQESDNMTYREGKFAGFGEINLPDYHALKDLQEHHIDSTYNGLVVAKKLSDIILTHLKERHGVDLQFIDRLSEAEWEHLFSSVDIDDLDDTVGRPKA